MIDVPHRSLVEMEPKKTISVIANGRMRTAKYWIEGKILHVESARLGKKKTFLGTGNRPEILAEMLLRSLVREAM